MIMENDIMVVLACSYPYVAGCPRYTIVETSFDLHSSPLVSYDDCCIGYLGLNS